MPDMLFTPNPDCSTKVLKSAVDAPIQTGVQSEYGHGAVSRGPITPVVDAPAIGAIRRTMYEIRASGKPGMFVARWDPKNGTWCIHRCSDPERAHEMSETY
jgi:hypothetical protein